MLHPLKFPPDKSAPDKSVFGPTMYPVINENAGGNWRGVPIM